MIIDLALAQLGKIDKDSCGAGKIGSRPTSTADLGTPHTMCVSQVINDDDIGMQTCLMVVPYGSVYELHHHQPFSQPDLFDN